MIAKSDDDTRWISKKEWVAYSSAVRKAGCLVIGRRTYHILSKQPEFSEFKNIIVVVVSGKNFLTLTKNHLIAHSPKEALGFLEKFEEVIVAGGGTLNTSFLVENLVDEIYLDIEPIILGKGIQLFKEKDFERKLKFLGKKEITKNEIQLHYKILR